MKEMVKRSRIVAPVFAVTLGLAACGGSSSAQESPQGDGGTAITEVVLSNGTPCAVMDSPRGRALSCGWEREEQKPTDLHGMSGTAITEITLTNGVMCAVMDAKQGKAISCDWEGPRIAPTDTIPHGDGGTAITTVTLPSGTECAVMDGTPGKALSCN